MNAIEMNWELTHTNLIRFVLMLMMLAAIAFNPRQAIGVLAVFFFLLLVHESIRYKSHGKENALMLSAKAKNRKK